MYVAERGRRPITMSRPRCFLYLPFPPSIERRKHTSAGTEVSPPRLNAGQTRKEKLARRHGHTIIAVLFAFTLCFCDRRINRLRFLYMPPHCFHTFPCVIACSSCCRRGGPSPREGAATISRTVSCHVERHVKGTSQRHVSDVGPFGMRRLICINRT